MHFPCQYLFQHFENIQTRLTSLRFDLHRYFLCKRLQINSKVDTHTNTCIHTYIHTHITFTFLTRQILPVISTGDINTSYSLPLQIQGLALQTPYTCEKTSHYRWFCTDMWNKTRYFKRMFYQNHNWQNKNVSFSTSQDSVAVYTRSYLCATFWCRVTSQTDKDVDIFISKYLTRRYGKTDRHRKCVVHGQTSVQSATRQQFTAVFMHITRFTKVLTVHFSLRYASS